MLTNREKKNSYQRKYRSENIDKNYGYRKKYIEKYPWCKTLDDMRYRVKHDKSYLDIQCGITREEIKTLWFRDFAYLMKRPSIDRIDTYGDYVFSNCRFIEFIDNLKRPKRKRKTIEKLDR